MNISIRLAQTPQEIQTAQSIREQAYTKSRMKSGNGRDKYDMRPSTYHLLGYADKKAVCSCRLVSQPSFEVEEELGIHCISHSNYSAPFECSRFSLIQRIKPIVFFQKIHETASSLGLDSCFVVGRKGMWQYYQQMGFTPIETPEFVHTQRRSGKYRVFFLSLSEQTTRSDFCHEKKS